MGLFDAPRHALHAPVDKNIKQKLQDVSDLYDEITALKKQKEELAKEVAAESGRIEKKKEEANQEIARYLEKQKSLIDDKYEAELDIATLGFSDTDFQFETVDEYKERLKQIRAEQKEYAQGLLQNIRRKGDFQFNGSVSKGRKALANMQTMILRGFNAECDACVSKVRTRNYEASKEKIKNMARAYSRLEFMEVNCVDIPNAYINLKIEELEIAYEYAQFKENEKENARKLREQQREEAKLKKEIEEKRKLLKKEQLQYEQELKSVKEQIRQNGLTPELEEKVAHLNANLAEVDRATKDVDYREANKRAGYVYVISNIGAFGEGVYKIGMTRRLDPTERVRELGDASVPFTFDTHALIFSDDAPALEAALHNEFDNRRVNLVNKRREFFRVSLDEIKRVVRMNYDGTVEFFEHHDADQYRMSAAMRQASNGKN